MAYQLSEDPGVKRIEETFSRMQDAMSIDFDLVADFHATLKHAQPVAKVGESVAEAMVTMSGSDGNPAEMMNGALRGAKVKLGNGIEHTLRLNHGPLEPIFPGHCHVEIWICNPFGETCIVIEIPWWCGPDDGAGDTIGDIVIF